VSRTFRGEDAWIRDLVLLPRPGHGPGTPPPSLSIVRNADQTVNLSWRGAGTLEQTCESKLIVLGW
jgi:hypothetical protein